MSGKLYNLIFKGEVTDQYTVAQVKDNFAESFKKDPATLEPLFSGVPCTLVKNLDRERAEKQAMLMKRLGAIVHVIQADDISAVPASGQTKYKPKSSASEKPEANLSSQHAELPYKENHRKEKNESLIAGAIEQQKSKATNEKINKRSWLRYRFDTFMAKGGASIFKALTVTFLIIFISIAATRGLFLLFFPEAALQYENSGFFANLYITFLQLTDPGNMAQDIQSSPWYKVFAVLAGLAGIIMLSALIAFITTSMDQKINELKRGHSKVIENNHTLILGWNEQRIVEIIRELILANESEDDACVVILADKDKEEMDDALRLSIPNSKTTRLVTRSGNVSTIANLDMVSIERCKSVIILADCEDTDSAAKKASSDAKAIQTVLATTGKGPDDEDFNIVVEIFNPTHREIVKSTFPEHVVTVNTSDILAKLLVQTSRSIGLSVVYNEILSFDGCEMYFHTDDWGEINFGQLGYHFSDGVPMGVRQADGGLIMNPEVTYKMRDGDDILIVADDDSTIEYQSEVVAIPDNYELAGGRLPQRIERELVLGWNHKSAIILREFADYVEEGSEIHILLKTPSDNQRKEITTLNNDLDGIDLKLIEKDRLDRDELMKLKPFSYDNIIILASNDGETDNIDAQHVDSENIVALLLLRSIFNVYPEESKKTKLITEVLDSQNYPLVARAGVKDVIISNRLVSMIMAQISESRDIQKVYDDIFQEDGSEIYLKPAKLYFKSFPIDVSFADMMAIAQKREEICIGVKIKALESDNEQNNGVQLIPDKNTRFAMQADDNLVVLAEDEL